MPSPLSVQLRSKEDAAQLSWKDMPCLLSSGLLPAAFDRGGGREGALPQQADSVFPLGPNTVLVGRSHAGLVNSLSACPCDIYSPMGSWLFNEPNLRL